MTRLRASLFLLLLAFATPVVADQGIGVGTGVSFQWLRGNVTASPIFAVDWEGGIASLDRSLTINGTTVAPTFWYDATDATVSTWTATVGTDASVAGSNSDPTVGQGTPLPNTTDESVAFASGNKYYSVSTTGHGGLGTDDAVFEFVAKLDAGVAGVIANRDTGAGWQIQTGTTTMQALLHDGTNSAPITISTPPLGEWAHYMLFVDRSGDARWYINGASASGLTNVSAVTGNVTDNDIGLTIGFLTGAGTLTGNIAQVAMWQSDSWLDNPSQLTLAAERFAKLTGTWADTGSVGPSTATRSSSAYLTKYNTTSSAHELYLVGDNWIRTGLYNDGSESRYNVQVEDSAENINTYSEDFANAAWIKTASSISSSSVDSPDPTKTMEELIEDGTASGHYVNSALFSFTSGNTYAMSVYAKAGSGTRFIQVLPSFAVGGTSGTTFDLSDGTFTTTAGTGSGVGYSESIGGGIYRCVHVFTAQATGTYRSFFALVENESDGLLNSYTGDSSSSVYIFGAQLELGAYPTTYVPTTSAAVTRAQGTLQYTLDALVAPITWVTSTNMTGLGIEFAVGNERMGLSSAGPTTTNVVGNFRDSAATTQANIAKTGLTNFTWTDLRWYANTNDFEFWVNGVSAGTDVSGTGPTGLTTLKLWISGGTPFLGGVQGPHTIYNAKVEP